MEVQLKRPTCGNASRAQLKQLKDGVLQAQDVVMMSCKALPGMSMADKDGAVRFNRTSETDVNQQWLIEYSSGHKDVEGKPAFAIVNLGTCMAIKIPDEAEQPVRLVTSYIIPNPLDPEYTSLLWTAEDTEIKIIREYKDRNLVLAAPHQGQRVVASNHNGGDSRRWSFQKRINPSICRPAGRRHPVSNTE